MAFLKNFWKMAEPVWVLSQPLKRTLKQKLSHRVVLWGSQVFTEHTQKYLAKNLSTPKHSGSNISFHSASALLICYAPIVTRWALSFPNRERHLPIISICSILAETLPRSGKNGHTENVPQLHADEESEELFFLCYFTKTHAHITYRYSDLP